MTIFEYLVLHLLLGWGSMAGLWLDPEQQPTRPIHVLRDVAVATTLGPLLAVIVTVRTYYRW